MDAAGIGYSHGNFTAVIKDSVTIFIRTFAFQHTLIILAFRGSVRCGRAGVATLSAIHRRGNLLFTTIGPRLIAIRIPGFTLIPLTGSGDAGSAKRVWLLAVDGLPDALMIGIAFGLADASILWIAGSSLIFGIIGAFPCNASAILLARPRVIAFYAQARLTNAQAVLTSLRTLIILEGILALACLAGAFYIVGPKCRGVLTLIGRGRGALFCSPHAPSFDTNIFHGARVQIIAGR